MCVAYLEEAPLSKRLFWKLPLTCNSLLNQLIKQTGYVSTCTVRYVVIPIHIIELAYRTIPGTNLIGWLDVGSMHRLWLIRLIFLGAVGLLKSAGLSQIPSINFRKKVLKTEIKLWRDENLDPESCQRRRRRRKHRNWIPLSLHKYRVTTVILR